MAEFVRLRRGDIRALRMLLGEDADISIIDKHGKRYEPY